MLEDDKAGANSSTVQGGGKRRAVNAANSDLPRCRTGYNARVDRFDAIRLLEALVAAGAKPNAAMDSAWVDEIAVRDVSLHGTQLASALAYAEGQGWLVDNPRKGWVSLTRLGEAVAKLKRKELLQKLKVKLSVVSSRSVLSTPLPSSHREVPLKKEGGTFLVPVQINGAITLNFTIDSGAADVSVPADVFSTLRRTGTITDADITGERTYVLANGSKTKSVTFTIRSLRVGDKVVENVRGAVTPAEGSLLLGQSFLEHFKSWSFDNTKHQLVLEP